MLWKYYNNNTLSTHLPTQKVATCQILDMPQNEVNMVNEPLKVEKPVLECSSEMDKLRCITDTALSPVTKIIVMGTNGRILSDGGF